MATVLTTNRTILDNLPNTPLGLLGGLIVKGAINSKQHCPVCKKKFKNTIVDNQGIYCPDCLTRPTRYYISGVGFGIGHLYSEPKTGKVFESYGQALDVLIAVNRVYKESHKFNPDDWIPAKLAEKKIENLCETWLKNYKEEARKKAKSRVYVNSLTYACNTFIIPFFRGKDIRDIDRDDIEKFYHHLLDSGYSTKYIRHILNTIKSLMLRYRTDLPEFPNFTVVPKKEKQRLGLEREFIIMDKVPEKYRLPILVLLRTGMRINEVIALKVHDIVDGIIYVDKAISDNTLRLSRKSGGVVTYRVTPELWQYLSDHIKDKDLDAFLFISPDGTHIKDSRLYKVWAKACIRAKVKHISLQQASRHSRASNIMDEYKRKALEEISKQLGHDNLTTGQKHYVID